MKKKKLKKKIKGLHSKIYDLELEIGRRDGYLHTLIYDPESEYAAEIEADIRRFNGRQSTTIFTILPESLYPFGEDTE